ncbi:MAG: peptidoglycan-binding protein [Bdellovibrionia bacterium]
MAERPLLKTGSKGQEVNFLQEKLRANGHAIRVTGVFDEATKKAVMAFQNARGLTADGTVGPKTWAALEAGSVKTLKCGPVEVLLENVFRMCPDAPRGNIEKHLPEILAHLEKRGLAKEPIVRLAIATVYTETRSFVPLSEFPSKYNTKAGGAPFALYDDRKDLGNTGAPDGERFRGRGFIQLTGRANYKTFGAALGIDLVKNPERANEPGIAAAVLCEYLKKREALFTQALESDDLAKARKLVNGGSHGLDVFEASFGAWQKKAA